jgi:hypothetical protein
VGDPQTLFSNQWKMIAKRPAGNGSLIKCIYRREYREHKKILTE